MIDDRGRLWGKINVIDLAVVLCLLLVVAGLVYREKAKTAIVNPRTVEVKVVCPFVYPEVVPNLKVGDQLVANGVLVPVFVKALEVRPALVTVSKPDGSMILTQNPFRKDIFVTLEGKTNAISPAEIVLGGQKVRAGKEDFYVKTQKCELKATVLRVEVKD